MGNVLLRGGIDPRRRIKIKKVDGSLMKLWGPLCVKEILIDYPNHGIFEAPVGRPLGMGSFSRPLPGRTGLVGGHLYYLIPLAVLEDYSNDMNRDQFARASSYHSIRRGSSSLRPKCGADNDRDSIKQGVDDVINNIKDDIRIVSSSYSTDGSRVWVNLRVRKEELASLLSGNNVNVVMENVMVRPLIRHVTTQLALSRWKPSLDTITEPHSPVGDL